MSFTSALITSTFVVFRFNGGRSSVVRVSEFYSEDPGFDHEAGQGEGQFFCLSQSTLVHICVPDPTSCVRHAPKFVCTYVKDLISICRK